MATCRDCVHVEVCRYYISSYAQKAGVDIPAALFEGCLNGDVCEQFLARDRMAALPYPVKPGDELWYILDGMGEINLRDYQTTCGDCALGDEPDIVFDVGTRGFWINGLGKQDAEAVSFEDCFLVSWDEIGKMYFLSRKAAEEAMKEREKDGQGTDDRGSN